jgi:amino acid adenylation domain-containing protein
VLGRYAGSDDICIGYPITERGEREVGRVGPFVNTVVQRVNLSGSRSFRELVRTVRSACLAGYEHKDLPFDEVVQALEVERSPGRMPVFQVLFNQLEQVEPVLRLGGLEVELERVRTAINLDLEVEIHDVAEEIVVLWEYPTELFEPATIARMARCFATFLADAVRHPDLPLSRLALLPADELTTVTSRWARPPRGGRATSERTFAELFAAQVGRTPDAVAVCAGDAAWSYAELDRRANQLAWALVDRGVGPDVVVALLAERGMEFLAAVLAIFKAGGAYLPLDPHQPPDRIAQLLAQSGTPLVVVDHGRAELLDRSLAVAKLAPGSRPGVLELKDRTGAGRDDSPPLRSRSANLAYVIYTSGSTGSPKGALIEQRGMMNHLFAKVDELALSTGDQVAQTASQCFDISVWQFLAPLLGGARARVYLDDVARDPARLVAQLERDRISIVEVVPSLLGAMIEHLNRNTRQPDLAALRFMIPTGEALAPDLCAAWFGLYPGIPLVNAFGPTECSDDVTHHVMRAWSPEARTVPIGRPLPNLSVYVVDGGLAPQPIGVIGELCVGGVGVGRGYLDDPGRTADAFRPDPFAEEPGQRMYRTGDLGRFRPDGELEYHGRRDRQLKVRGFRVEPGEIEATLRSHPTVADAAVVTANSVLAAFVTPRGERPDRAQLVRVLAERLPDYMVPTVIEILDTLPKTANGKVDHNALAARSRAMRERAADDGAWARRGTLEELCASLLADVLDVERVGVDQDFFALGGHSLAAVRLVARIHAATGVELPLRTLFENPTVTALAQALGGAMREGPADELPLVALPAVYGEPAPLSFAQERLWVVSTLTPDETIYNEPVMVRIRGALDRVLLASCLQQLVDRHDLLRSRIVITDGRPAQIIADHLTVSLPVLHLAAPDGSAEPERVARAAHRLTNQPIDLARGPLFAAALVPLGDDDWLFGWTFHHIIVDRVSIELLVSELSRLYSGARRGERVELPPMAVRYTDYVRWQRERLSRDRLEHELAYWKRRLTGAERLRLPADRATGPRTTNGAASAPFRISQHTATALRAIARREGVTLFMLAEAAFLAVLYRHTGQRDLTVGLTVDGRSRRDLEHVVGVFINSLALRVELAPNESFRSLLGRVREAAVGAFAHQEVPFETVVDAVEVERDLSRLSPLFQILFELRSGRETIELELDGLECAIVDFDRGNTKFDLALMMDDRAGLLQGRLQYSTDLFAPATVAGLIERIVHLFQVLPDELDTAVEDLPIVPPDERVQLLERWSGLAGVPARRQDADRIEHVFDAAVERSPDAIALRFEGQAFSYRQLDGWSRRLAGYLATRGVTDEVVVGVCLEPGPERVATLLAVLRAGGIYLPLDPGLPPDRLGYMVQDAGAFLVVTTEDIDPLLPSGARVLIGLEWERAMEHPELPAGRAAPAGALAYIIYTSGSSGRPKGVMVEPEV